LTIYEAVKHILHLLQTWHFIIFTQHKPIAYLTAESGQMHSSSTTCIS
jgi:hypothetical protein